jgi:hypothetical protein
MKIQMMQKFAGAGYINYNYNYYPMKIVVTYMHYYNKSDI